MWLSRAGVIEQADSGASPPTISSATISSVTPNTINFVTSENCTYTSTTGITVTSTASAAVAVTAVGGSNTAGGVTLSRAIVGGEGIQIIFAATNGVTSQATGLPIAAVTFSVTNNTAAATTPQFGNFTWSSAAAGTSLTSDANGTGATFPVQTSGLAVQFPNWVGYGATGAAVTDTSIKLNTSGFDTGFTAGNALTNFVCTLVTNQTAGTGPGFQDSGTPYFTGQPNGLVQGTNTLGSSITTNTTDAANNSYTLTSAQFGTSGSGTGATIVLKVANNIATGASVTLTGTGYTNGDTITIPTSIIGGTSAVVITLAADDISSLSSRSVGLTADQLNLISLPAITTSGKLSGLVEFDILSLLTTALGTTTTLQYTDAIPASNAPGGTNGTQTSSFFLRVAINGVDNAGGAWAQALDVRTSEANPYDGGPGNLSGPITATPTLVSVRLCELDNPDNVVGQVATAGNSWSLGNIPSSIWPNGSVGAAELRVVFQANSYVYNNPISLPATTLVFDGAQFQFIAVNPGLGNVITYEGGQTVANLDGSNPPFPIQPQPASVPIPAGGGAVDGGFSFRVNPSFSDDPLIPTKAFDGSPPGNYDFQINLLSPGGLVEIKAYSYQLSGDVTADQTPIAPPPGITVSGTYQVV